jgi:flavin reductase (DIM6/NTAB) family NADH-FMN oxidoreductase RutF
MPLDLGIANQTISGLRTFPVAVTTLCEGRSNGLMSLSAGAASIVPEAPRATISITKYNFSHDLIQRSGVFAVHLLSREPDMLAASLAIFMALGGSSGRDGDKLAKLATRSGATGSPILTDALVYFECRVVGSLDAQENTLFLGDVVAAETLRAGRRLDIGHAWSQLPPAWLESYERNHEPQIEAARRLRGLAR